MPNAICRTCLLLLVSVAVVADSWQWAPDYPTGARLPDFSALTTTGETISLSQTAGPGGTLLVFLRSADW